MTAIDTEVTYCTVAGNDISQFITAHSLEPEASIYDFTGYGVTWQRNRGGLKKWTLHLEGFYDDGVVAPPSLILPALGTLVAIVFGPEGSTTGKTKRTGNAITGKYTEAGKIDGLQTWAIDYTGDNTLTDTVF